MFWFVYPKNSEFNCFLIWFVRDLILTLKTLFLALEIQAGGPMYLQSSTLYNPCECDKCDANEPQQNTDRSDNNKMVLFALLCMQISLPTLLKYLLVTRLQQRNAGMRSLLNPRDIRSGLQIRSVKCVHRSKGDKTTFTASIYFSWGLMIPPQSVTRKKVSPAPKLQTRFTHIKFIINHSLLRPTFVTKGAQMPTRFRRKSLRKY